MLLIYQLDLSMRFKIHSCNGSCTKDVKHLSGSGSNAIVLITGRQLKNLGEINMELSNIYLIPVRNMFTSSYLIVPETKVNKGMEKVEQRK